MLFAIVLLLTWLILLIRYPRHALPILLLAAFSIGVLALAVAWSEARHAKQLKRVSLTLTYAPQRCPAQTPLELTLHNTSDYALSEVRFKVTAFAPEVSANLIQSGYAELCLPSSQRIDQGAHISTCLALPPLRPGYRPSGVSFAAQDLKARLD